MRLLQGAAHVLLADDVVAVEDGARLVAADLHGAGGIRAGPHEVPDRCAAQIVGTQALRMQQLVSAIMADYVFALKFDEIVFNPYTGGDAGNLAPIQHIVQEFGKDFRAPVSAEELMGTSAGEDAGGEVSP
jgi:hypothetical protein